MNEQFAVLCDAGVGIGLGHFSRCSALRNYLNNKGKNAILICQWTGSVNSRAEHKKYNWQSANAIKMISETCDTAVVDTYNICQSLFEKIADYFDKLIVIDDYGRLKEFKADLVVNPNVFGNTIEYANPSVGGAEYVILRQSFRRGVLKKTVREEVKNILVTLGGSDYRGLIPDFTKHFRNLPYKFTFVCASDRYAQELSKKNKSSNFRFLGFVDESKMHNLMIENEMAITACGQTLHELTKIGCPAVGIVIDQDQELNGKFYFQLGSLLECFDWDDEKLMNSVATSIEKNKVHEIRSRCSKKGRDVMDGKGIERIFNKIVSL